jgi:dTDP-4-dehydrorhamnose reductase
VKILLTGANGQIGTELKLLLENASGFELAALPRSELDICDPDATRAAVEATTPDIVVNAAAYTAVDAAERDRATAFAVNADGAGHVAAACDEFRSVLIHLSTDFVFDGTRTDAYRETDPVNPVNVYGASKAAGETVVRDACAAHVILRTAWVYSPWRRNFMTTMLRLMADDQPLRIVSDQNGCPTAAADVAQAIIEICARLTGAEAGPRYGTYHYCGNGVTSWFGFATEIARVFAELDGRIPALTAIPSDDYPTAANRPVMSALNCDLIQEIFGVSTVNWRSAVEREVRRYWDLQATEHSA